MNLDKFIQKMPKLNYENSMKLLITIAIYFELNERAYFKRTPKIL